LQYYKCLFEELIDIDYILRYNMSGLGLGLGLGLGIGSSGFRLKMAE